VAQNPERAVHFASAMKVMTSKPEFDLSYAIDYFDWASLGKAEIVDVGGTQGHFALRLARRHPNPRILVQDMAPVIQGANAGDMADRVSFMSHNLFEPQTISTDAYFFRWIFHNWSDQHCLRILKAQLPVLMPGNRLMVQEVLMQEAGTIAQWKAKDSRYVPSIPSFPDILNMILAELHVLGQWISRWRIHSAPKTDCSRLEDAV
jgi:trans-aconitate methyltransferase